MNSVVPFLKQHCVRCHGADKQENGKRFDTLGTDLSQRETLISWQGILDQINLGDMPPADEPQPDSKDVLQVVESITKSLKAAYVRQRSTGAQTVVRRLNRFELRNTMRDLLYLNDPELRIGNVARLVDNNGNGSVENTSTDPFRAFPADEVIEGLDNIGDRLVMSDFLLKLMLNASEESLALATETGPRPQVAPREFAGHISSQNNRDLERFARELYRDFDSLYRRGVIFPNELGGGVGVSARYRITFEVSAVNQKHPWSELIPGDQNDPMLLTLRLFKSRTRNEHIHLTQLELPGDGKRRTISFESWIDQKWLPQLTWENGPSDREARTDLLLQKYLPDQYRKAPDQKQIPDKQKLNEARARWFQEMATALLSNYRGPIVRVHRMKLEPLIDRWPPKSHTALYGDGPLSEESIEPLLLAFARRAFRRPVAAAEIAPYVELVRSQWQPQLTEPSATAIRDLKFKTYQGKWSKLPDFSKLAPDQQGDLKGGLVDTSVAQTDEHFGVVFTGKIHARKKGSYEFKIASDDGCRLLIDGAKVVEHDGLHGASPKTGATDLAVGDHSIRIEYFAYGQPNSLAASWSGPGFKGATLSTARRQQPKSGRNAQNQQAIKALQVGYMSILCSPEFLYLQEKSSQLNNFEIASRLSYFLWSSMPDDRLMQLADEGKLTDMRVIEAEVERMLSNNKAAAFHRHFAERWLRLDKIAESPPELNGPFRIYWDRKMEPQIISQTVAYFADIVDSNGPIRDFIDSDYTYLNQSIAEVFYGRKDVTGDRLRKTPTNDPRRGGILTHPSVMTATANGVDTSPVVRGVWVLENILGSPPSPPPPDVEPLPTDLRDAKTIREQLAVHRDQKACNSCHRKIDPLGFAFENFDPIGRWREKYPKVNGPIDASATMSNGEQIADIVEFKQVLLKRERDVTRCLTEKLLAYASGRLLEPIDRGEVDRIVAQLNETQGGLRDLIKLVATSEVFLSK